MQNKALAALLVTATAMLAACGSSPTSQQSAVQGSKSAGSITQFALPATCNAASGCEPVGITRGPDGDLWFADQNDNAIGRITTAGTITTFRLSNSGGPVEITAGPDGDLWFTESHGSAIGRITPTGTITTFPLPATCGRGGQRCEPAGITRGPDGNIWFTVPSFAIGNITPAGKITLFTSSAPFFSPAGITAGPDGNLWFTETLGSVGRITPAGKITTFRLPNRDSRPAGIAAGPAGDLWFAECTYHISTGNCSDGQIRRLSTAGTITGFPLPNPASSASGIAAGPAGSLWFTASICAINVTGVVTCHSGQIGRITTAGTISEFPLPDTHSSADHITAGPDGNLWFTEAICQQFMPFEPIPMNKCSASQIGRITP